MRKSNLNNLFWFCMYIMPFLIFALCLLNHNYNIDSITDVFAEFDDFVQLYNLGDFQSVFITLFNEHLSISQGLSNILGFICAYYLIIAVIRVISNLFKFVLTFNRE